MTNSYILEEEEEAGHGHSRGRCLFELGVGVGGGWRETHSTPSDQKKGDRKWGEGACREMREREGEFGDRWNKVAASIP